MTKPTKARKKSPQKPPENTPEMPARGRPSREEVERRRVLALGVDPTWVEPRRILAGIAIDETAPATARVQALKLLIATGAGAPALPPAALADETSDEPGDELTRRALALMAAHGRPN